MSSVIEKERRTGQSPIPANIQHYINASQRHGLRQLEGFGWHIKFVRAPLFQPAIIFMADSAHKIVGILLDDGTVSNVDMPVIR